MALRRLKERVAKGVYHIHVDGAVGNGATLCGYAYEGTTGYGGVVEVTRGRINCRTCKSIIFLCKSIPAKAISK